MTVAYFLEIKQCYVNQLCNVMLIYFQKKRKRKNIKKKYWI